MTDCERYDGLMATLETEEGMESLGDSDWEFILKHEESCPGEHSTTALEERLGIPIGSLVEGSPEHGIPSAAEVMKRIRERL